MHKINRLKVLKSKSSSLGKTSYCNFSGKEKNIDIVKNIEQMAKMEISNNHEIQ